MQRSIFRGNLTAYQWLANNAAPGSLVFAYSDPLMYLYSGHRGISARIPPRLLYKAEPGAIAAYIETVPSIARAHGLSYVLFTTADFQFDSPEVGLATLRRVLGRHSDFEVAYQSPQATIYRVRP
jgi:hypothetical protein